MYEAILAVDGVAPLVQPNYFQLMYSDQSNEQAGRTEDVVMHKNMIGTITGIDLGWQNVTTAEGSNIINLFWNEYVIITFLDLKAGGYITKEFYTGDKTGNLYSAALGKWESIKFNIRSRKGNVENEI